MDSLSKAPSSAGSLRSDRDRMRITQTWDEISAHYVELLKDYFERRGMDPTSPATESTIRTNSELVPRRGDNILRWLAEQASLPDIRGLEVLELGSGFGSLAAYLAWKGQPARLVGVDVVDAYVEMGRLAAQRLNVPNVLEFAKADMRDLRAFPDRSFDVLILNNAYIYLASRADAQLALREFHRVLRPGGAIIFHHANKWRLREPFTRAPLVHLLPAPLARLAGKATGWKHNHGRVRLLSAAELARRLRRAGFETVNVGSTSPSISGWRRYFASYYVVTARTS
jgi:ubiquinone/menaquinone biosynthesis C-methylase UbiE